MQGRLGDQDNADDEVIEALIDFGGERPTVFGGLWIDRSNGGAVVMSFVDAPEPHRRAIDEEIDLGGTVIDVVQVRFSASQLFDFHERAFDQPGPSVVSAGVDTSRNRVAVGVHDPTEDDLASLASSFEGLIPLDAVCLEITRSVEAADGPLAVLPRDGFDHLLTCGSFPFPQSALNAEVPIAGSDHPAASALDELASSDSSVPSEGWFVLRLHDRVALFGLRTSGQLKVGVLRKEADEWQLLSVDVCTMSIGLPLGLATVGVTLDRRRPPEPSSSVVHLLVTERGCSSGREGGEFLRGPEVIETDESVIIAFAIEVPTDAFVTCPRSPATAVTVQLDSPLGDRELLNGLELPPAPIEAG